MKKYLFGIFLGLLFVFSFKLDSFAFTKPFHINIYNGVEGSSNRTRNLYQANGLDDALYCVKQIPTGEYNGTTLYSYLIFSNTPNSIDCLVTTYKNGEVLSSVNRGFNFSGSSPMYGAGQLGGNNSIDSSIPVFNTDEQCTYYLSTGDVSDAVNKDNLPFDSVLGDSNIPTPVVNWALNNDGSLSRTLQFTNAQLPANPNIRMGLQLIVHWASVDNISMSYSNQSAGLLSTGYSVFYDNALSQDGLPMGYPLPDSVSDMKPCPSEINFITNTDSIALFNSFLTYHPVSERTITYSPSGISSFAESFRNHLADIDFAYNVPYVSCRYYYKSADGSDLNYGGWTNTYPKLPAQGAVLSINKQNGQITVPVNDGTVNQGYDINDNPIFDNGTVIESPELVNFDDLNNSVHNLFGYLGQFPSFLAYLFPFLPSWIPILLASVIGTLIVIGVIRILLK